MPEFISILRWIRDIVYPKTIELENAIRNLPDQITGGYSQEYINVLENNIRQDITNVNEELEKSEILETIEQLLEHDGTGLVIVKDTNRGGAFVSKLSTDIDQNTGNIYVVNNLDIFVKHGGGFWVRQNPTIENKPQFTDPNNPFSSLNSKKIVVNLNNDSSDNKVMVISKKNSDTGYVGTIIYKNVSPSDSNNMGGDSNYRPQGVINIPLFYSAKTGYISKSSGATLALGAGLTASQINMMWNYEEFGNEPTSVEIGTVPFNFSSRNIWNLTTTNEYIIYKSDSEECDIRAGITNGSSTSVKIQVSIDGTNFIDYSTISLQQTPSGTTVFKDIKVKYNNSYYIKIINLAVGSCYVAGLDFNYSLESSTANADCVVYMQSPSDINSVPTVYLSDGGANEFAAHKLGGKWFGTYHGGHSNFEEKLKVSVQTGNLKTYNSYNMRSSSIPKFILTNFVELHSHSTLTYDSTTYDYNCETQFADGVNNSISSIEHKTGDLILCDTIYTHMCTTQRNFDYIRQPIYLNKDDDGDITLGNVSFVSQYNSIDSRQINCYFSTMDCSKNVFGGARILFAPQYNKQYYGGTINSTNGTLLNDSMFRTIKEFL